jgi:hypothetical protein
VKEDSAASKRRMHVKYLNMSDIHSCNDPNIERL